MKYFIRNKDQTVTKDRCRAVPILSQSLKYSIFLDYYSHIAGTVRTSTVIPRTVHRHDIRPIL